MVSSQLIQSSISQLTGVRLDTFVWEYPRFIHAEVLTHRVLSKNAGSSRAIPVISAMEIARDHMVIPEFKYNKSGMQPAGFLSVKDMERAKAVWKNCAGNCLEAAAELNALKVHKQWANRMLEWFSPIRIVATATDLDNFLWLRNDSEAQDEIEMLASQVEHQLATIEPLPVPWGHLHVPFVERKVSADFNALEYFVGGASLSLGEALSVSASVCAQMSYRKADTSLEKAARLYADFMEGRRIHASPFEHQGIAIPGGYTHTTRQGDDYSGNLRGWTQYRHLIQNNTCYDLQTARMLEMVQPAGVE